METEDSEDLGLVLSGSSRISSIRQVFSSLLCVMVETLEEKENTSLHIKVYLKTKSHLYTEMTIIM